MNQKTVAASCVLRGVGVHSGQPSVLTIQPAPVDYGLVWVSDQVRDDGKDISFVMGATVPVVAPHATVLASKHARISTVEHVMAALWQQGITNARLELQGDEVPILDGSSIAIIWELERVGVVTQDAPAQFVSPKETVTFADESRGGVITWIPNPAVAKAMADTQFRDDGALGCGHGVKSSVAGVHQSSSQRRLGSSQNNHSFLTIDYQAPEGSYKGTLTPEAFARDIAPARTFGDIAQLPALRAHGLARGSTLGNTLAFASGTPLNTPRFADEPVRHKVLDLIGDLFLIGLPMAGHIIARNTGHSFNREVVAHFVAHPEAWQVVEQGDPIKTLVSHEEHRTY